MCVRVRVCVCVSVCVIVFVLVSVCVCPNRRWQYETLDAVAGAVDEGAAHLLNGAHLHNDGYRVYRSGQSQFLAFQVPTFTPLLVAVSLLCACACVCVHVCICL